MSDYVDLSDVLHAIQGIDSCDCGTWYTDKRRFIEQYLLLHAHLGMSIEGAANIYEEIDQYFEKENHEDTKES